MEGVILAIDFGSKTSGFTAAAWLDLEGTVHLEQAKKGANADQWLRDLTARVQPRLVAIDAPLSLPGVYFGTPECLSFHYRHCDQKVSAMSPLFLGGLTARAMEFKSWILAELAADVIEVYPKLIAQEIALDKRYKKEASYLKEALAQLVDLLPGRVSPHEVENWHRFDALLALRAASKYAAGAAEKIGLETEGIIYF
jgi:predicted nuclease with RNAse H fold